MQMVQTYSGTLQVTQQLRSLLQNCDTLATESIR
jgi:hypothetical protein